MLLKKREDFMERFELESQSLLNKDNAQSDVLIGGGAIAA